MPLDSLAGRHVVITGASRGIGRALAEECARRGARLSLCARSEAALDDLTARTGAVGGVLDVCEADAVDRWLTMGVRQHGPIDVLVNNAGLLGPKAALADYPLDEWQEVMRVNVDGAFIVTRAALPHLRRPGGIVASLTSFLGRNALPRYGAYCASKFAVEGLARLVHVEHADQGLISCAVDPGMVQTEMLKAAQETDDVSGHATPHQAAARFADTLQTLDSTHSGTTVDLFPST